VEVLQVVADVCVASLAPEVLAVVAVVGVAPLAPYLPVEAAVT